VPHGYDGGDDARYRALLDEISAEIPGFRVVRKDQSRFQRAIAAALRVVTFGGQTSYLSHYQTTIGRTVYVTSDWDALPAAQRYVTMRHELVHLRQFRRYTLVGMAILYVLLPLPLGLAWFRARFEWEAYTESIRVAAELHGRAHVASGPFRERIVSQFTSGAYGWMWPFRGQVERWYDEALAALDQNERK
jgi:hypothetical protein